MSRIDDLRRRVQKKTSNVYDTLFTRRVSIYLTALLAPTKVTANHVSVVGAVVGLCACALIALGAPAAQVAGIALVHLYAVLDSVDGELARLRQTFSLKGLFIEDLSAYTMINAMNLAFAWVLHRDGHGVWPIVLAVAVAAFGRNAMPVARRAMMKSIESGRTPPAIAPAADRPEGGSRVRAFIEEHVLHLTNIWVILTSFLLVEIVTGWRAGLVACAFAFFMAGLLAKEAAVVVHLSRGDNLERARRELEEQAARRRERAPRD